MSDIICVTYIMNKDENKCDTLKHAWMNYTLIPCDTRCFSFNFYSLFLFDIETTLFKIKQNWSFLYELGMPLYNTRCLYFKCKKNYTSISKCIINVFSTKC